MWQEEKSRLNVPTMNKQSFHYVNAHQTEHFQLIHGEQILLKETGVIFFFKNLLVNQDIKC